MDKDFIKDVKSLINEFNDRIKDLNKRINKNNNQKIIDLF